MAPNRRPESEAQQHESSSEEEEEEDSGSSSEEETQDQPQHNITISTPKPQPTPNSSAPKKPQPTPNSSDSDSDSEYESDSDSPPTATTRRPDPNIKPITSKPMDDPPKSAKKPRSDPTPSTPAAKSSATAVKRPAAESESNGARDPKRAKKKQKEKDVAAVINNNEMTPSKSGGDDARKQMFQRLWGEDDEIVILKGLIDFRAKKGYDPMTDLNVFHDFIKKSLHLGDVSKSQFSTKVRRMKKKFENNMKRGKDGQDRSFSNPHEQRAYDLSKKIWGEDSDGFGVASATKVNGKGRKNEKGLSRVDEELAERVEEGARKEVEPNAGAIRAIGPDLSIEEVVVKDGLELLSGCKKLEMMKKWRQFRVEEMELYLKRLDLVREQGKLVLEAMKM